MVRTGTGGRFIQYFADRTFNQTFLFSGCLVALSFIAVGVGFHRSLECIKAL